MIPSELRRLDQWVLWRHIEREPGKTTKVPYQAQQPRTKASSTNPDTWAPYKVAAQALIDTDADGIGFVFSKSDPFCGVDFDNVVNGEGISDEVWEFIQELDTYTEYSPSGKGVHAIGRGQMQNGGKKTDRSPLGGGLEAYSSGRFFCVTGRTVPDTPVKIATVDIAKIAGMITPSSNGSTKSKTALGGDIKSRHDYLVHHVVDMFKAGVPQEAVEEAARAIARDIELPKREQDEVGRIIKHFFSPASVESRVNREVENLRVRHLAKRMFESEQSINMANVDDVILGSELIEKPDVEQAYVIEPIMSSGANVLLSAHRKTGKTTLILNLLRSLLDGEPFLGSMEVHQRKGMILFLNYEMIEDQIKNWVKKQDIKHADDLAFWQLKGKRLHFWEREVAEEISDFCREHGVWCIIIDTQILSMRGLVSSEDKSMEVADYQGALDELKIMSGVEVMLLVHHEGKDKERGSRGSTRIEDWPEAIWRLEKKPDRTRVLKLDSIRYYDSRDALPEELVLTFDKEHDRLFWDGASAVEHKAEEEQRRDLRAIYTWTAAQGRPPTRNELKTKNIVKGNHDWRREKLERYERQQLVIEVDRPDWSGRGRRPRVIVLTQSGEQVAGVGKS